MEITTVIGIDPNHTNRSAQTGKLKDLATRYQFEQLIKGHTRITDNTATLLDLAFTNKPENIVGAEIEHEESATIVLFIYKEKYLFPVNNQK